MHLRRALLLFAIVLASPPSRRRSRARGIRATHWPRPTPTRRSRSPESDTSPSAAPGDSPVSTSATPVTLEFDAAEDQTRRLEPGAAANVEVSVEEPGLVSIPLLGVSAPAEPVTPARFDLLVSQAGTYPVVFTPAQGDEEREVGTLKVRAPSE